ncbi:MAG: hypothetical protein ABR915_25945 [Thermoguttaceae bacterium]
MTLESGSQYVVHINGTTAGTDYTQTQVGGSISLGGATLVLNGSLANPNGQTIVLIHNVGSNAVSGAFAGLPEGQQVTFNGTAYTITYVAGAGADVALAPV